MGVIILQATNISKSYQNGRRELSVLRDFNLSVESGEIVTIMGQSGSGKSTALNIIGSLDMPDSGDVELMGESIPYHDDSALARLRNKHIGFVFQFHHLLPEFSALENCLVPAWIHQTTNQTERGKSLLQQVGLADRLHHLPSELSGGERSRVAVVRALMNQPAILLADEPTGNLDEKNANKLIDLLCEINKDFHQSIILTTHNPDVAKIGHRQYILDHGHLIQQDERS